MGRKSDLREWFQDWRNAREKARAERAQRRLMKTSTFYALAEAEDGEPMDWPQEVLESVLADTVAVQYRRRMERAQWIVLALVTAGFGYLGGLHIHEETKPQPWNCRIELLGETADEPDVVRCVGGRGEVVVE